MKDEKHFIYFKIACILGVVSLGILAFGIFVELPKWLLFVFAFCGSTLLTWGTTIVLANTFYPEWDEDKAKGNCLLFSLFIVINMFAWIFG